MTSLDAFLSTWSTARTTFGEGTPQPGAAYDQSASLDQFTKDLDRAAPGNHWSGGAATAYGKVNADHQRVFAELAKLDRRLAEQVDQSAQVVIAGRRDLDAIRSWVVAAAAKVPSGPAGAQMLARIVGRGLQQLTEVVTRANDDLATVGGRIARIGSEYQTLGGDAVPG